MSKIDEILPFVKLLHEFQSVERVVHVQGGERMENDVEHSYHLAMLAWYIASSRKLSLDKNLLIQYALIHDFVEVYAGDTYVYSKDQAHIDSKGEREEAAAKKLKEKFSEFPDLHELITQYEKKEDKESCFVYALDKVQPVLNIYLNNGRIWKEDNITIEMLREYKKDQVAVSPEIEEYFHDLLRILEEEKKELFTKKEK
jgi:putative hydrolase of HD superfamily